MSDTVGAPIESRVLDEASAWLMKLHAGDVTDVEREACRRWRLSSPEHGRAWALAERLLGKLESLPPALAMPALARPDNPGRRATTRKLLTLAAGVPVGWAASRFVPWQTWNADHRTAVGERRDIRLADGSRVTLNTGTSVDARFDPAQRLVRLHAGEILVETASDKTATHPFLVHTADGRLRALGTRFVVRQAEGHTRLAVLEGTVEVRPGTANDVAPRLLPAGRQVTFTASGTGTDEPADDTVALWTRGMFLADRMRLADFAEELCRYRHGVVRCDPAVGGLRISGAFPVQDTDRALAMLQSIHPVRAVYRTRYWVHLVPA